ncbi:MAG: aldo/keto reductase, partial [Erysipelotrichaceae bacterium]|nr:aldo/keto reductase [Erysipelotrichaceae bacterium]
SDRKGNRLSQLGFGCMRFTRSGSKIDYEKAEREVLKAIEMGVNYLDTAYTYPGSEELMGKIIASNNLRDKINLATKLPQYLIRSSAQIEKTFNEELQRLQTDHIDYYLMHMFTDYKEWVNLQNYGIEDWIAQKKKEGKIRNVGFSYHGDSEMFIKILNAYDWDFCQIQYNYLDEHSQAGVTGLRAAHEKGLPVIIMEPLRGGRLVNLPAKAMDLIRKDPHGYSSAEWGLRWLWNQPEVTVVLSGMNSLEMVQENCRIADQMTVGQFGEAEFKVIDQIRNIFNEKIKVGCTGCRYCMPCPQGVDIPGYFYYYNLMYMENKSRLKAFMEFAQIIGIREKPGFATLCVGCGKCEQHCPQHIRIREKLKEADKVLRPQPLRIGLDVARKFMVKRK